MKIVCISDTHCRHHQLSLPQGDVLVHAGDFTNNGSEKSIRDFGEWMREQDFDHKVVVAGNHDWLFQTNPDLARECLGPGMHYLQDETILIGGLKFYGAPWSVGDGTWAFGANDDELEEHWLKIPRDTNVLITHGPAHGILDVCPAWPSEPEYPGPRHVGSDSLGFRTSTYLRVLHAHICGHVHESYGQVEIYGKYNSYTTINASSFNHRAHWAPNEPIVIEAP